jgi:hypothetical protein
VGEDCEGKKQLEIPRPRRRNNIKKNIDEIR